MPARQQSRLQCVICSLFGLYLANYQYYTPKNTILADLLGSEFARLGDLKFLVCSPRTSPITAKGKQVRPRAPLSFTSVTAQVYALLRGTRATPS